MALGVGDGAVVAVAAAGVALKGLERPHAVRRRRERVVPARMHGDVAKGQAR